MSYLTRFYKVLVAVIVVIAISEGFKAVLEAQVISVAREGVPQENVFAIQINAEIYLCGKVGERHVPVVQRASGEYIPIARRLSGLRNKLRDLNPSQKQKRRKLRAERAALREVKRLTKEECKKGPPLAPIPLPTPETPDDGAPPLEPFIDLPLPTDLSPLVRLIDRDDINHLYRKAGLGVPPNEAYQFIGRSSSELVDYFMTYQPDPVGEENLKFWTHGARGTPNQYITPSTISHYLMMVLAHSPNQFHERLALIALHDRLSISGTSLQNYTQLLESFITHFDRLREVGRGSLRYDELIEELGEDPAMMVWLSIDGSTAMAPNENYARELMELFTLDTTNASGIPNYTNDDIRAVSRAFAGWRVSYYPSVRAEFFNDLADAGPHTIFSGTPFEGSVTNGRDVVRHIFSSHPHARRSTALWLAREYLREDTPEAIIQEIGELVHSNQYNLLPPLRRILSSELFFHPQNRFSTLKHPAERTAHFARAMRKAGVEVLTYNQNSPSYYWESNSVKMGCVIGQPETVFGCDRIEELPVSSRLFAQAAFASQAVSLIAFPERSDLAQVMGESGNDPDQAIARLEDLFAVSLTARQRWFLRRFLNTRNDPTTGEITKTKYAEETVEVRRLRFARLIKAFTLLPQVNDLR